MSLPSLHSTVLSPNFTQWRCSSHLYTVKVSCSSLHSAVLSPNFTQSRCPTQLYTVKMSLSSLHSVVLFPNFTQWRCPSHLYTVQLSLPTLHSQDVPPNLHSEDIPSNFTQWRCPPQLYTVKMSLPTLHSEDVRLIFTQWTQLCGWGWTCNTVNLSQVVVTNSFKSIIFCGPIFCLSIHFEFVLQTEKCTSRSMGGREIFILDTMGYFFLCTGNNTQISWMTTDECELIEW